MNAKPDRETFAKAAPALTEVKIEPAATPPEPAPVPARRRRSGRKLLIAALPVALVLGGGYLWATGGRYIGTEDAYVQQDRVAVMPQVSGQIAQVLVAENDTVQAGQTLFTIDNSAYRATVEEDRAKLESARLDVEKLKAAYNQATSAEGIARDALATAQSADDRQRSLLKTGVISQAAADDSALKLQQAKGALTQAGSAVISAKAALAGNPDIVTDQHPEVLQAMAVLHAAELDLAHTKVVAPGAGVVSQTDRLQQGQYVTPSVSVLSLVATGNSWIEANYKETDLTHMRAGQTVELRLDTYPDAVLKGVVGSIGAGTGSEFALLPAQNASGNWVKVVQRIPVRVKLDAGQEVPPLRAGMSASVEVDTGQVRGLPKVVAGTLAALGLGGRPAVAAAQ